MHVRRAHEGGVRAARQVEVVDEAAGAGEQGLRLRGGARAGRCRSGRPSTVALMRPLQWAPGSGCGLLHGSHDVHVAAAAGHRLPSSASAICVSLACVHLVEQPARPDRRAGREEGAQQAQGGEEGLACSGCSVSPRRQAPRRWSPRVLRLQRQQAAALHRLAGEQHGAVRRTGRCRNPGACRSGRAARAEGGPARRRAPRRCRRTAS